MNRLLLASVVALGLLVPPVQAASPPAGVAGMTRLAPQSGKIGAPVDVYYKHLVASGANDATLQLAVVPRMGGALRVELLPDKTVTIAFGGAPLALQKAAAVTAYNRQLRVQRAGNAPATIRALVSIDLGDARFHSIYYIPADPASAAALSPSGKILRKQPARQQ